MFFRQFKNLAQPKLVLVGSFGAGNLGDELILAGFLAELRKKIPQAEITVLRGSMAMRKTPGVTGSQPWGFRVSWLPLLPMGLRSFLSFNWFKTLPAIRQSDAVIFPGGGLFTDEESLRAILLWALHIFVAKLYWKPVYLFGQSVGPFRTVVGKKLTQWALSLATTIVVRDTASLLELKKLSVTATLGSDSALLLTAPKRKKLFPKRPKNILVTVRDYPRLPADFFERLAAYLQRYAQADTTLSFAPFTPEDVSTIQKAQKILSAHKIASTFVQMPIEPMQLIKMISQYDLVIGMRLHSLIAAYLAGVPSVGISYSRKVAEFQKSVGQKVSGLL